MNEDRELADFVKGRLEECVSPTVPRMDEIVRAATAESFSRAAECSSQLRRRVASLAAASFAVVLSFAVMHFARSPGPEDTVACVIDMRRVADGVSALDDGSSVSEMFLAWQDVPYESAIDGILSDD